MRKSNELQKGKAGEYLVCADLILMGFIAYPSEQGLPYDVVMDRGDGRLLKVQVKTTDGPRVVPQRKGDSTAYIFNIKRHGKDNLQIYGASEVDLFALVCLDTRQIGYVQNHEMPSTINIRVDALRGTYYDEDGIATHKKAWELFTSGMANKSEIARSLGKQIAVVHKMLKPDYVPHQTGARYFSDFERTPNWFTEINL